MTDYGMNGVEVTRSLSFLLSFSFSNVLLTSFLQDFNPPFR